MMVVSRIREEAEKGTRSKIKEDDHERSIRSSKTNNSIRILVNAHNTPRIKRDGLLAETIFFIFSHIFVHSTNKNYKKKNNNLLIIFHLFHYF